MDTKLKNNLDWKDGGKKVVEKARASRTFILMAIAIMLLLMSYNMVASYPNYVSSIDLEESEAEHLESDLQEIVQSLMRGSIFLCAQAEPVEDALTYREVMENYGGDDFFLLKKFLSYEITDGTGNVVLSTLAEEKQGTLFENLDSYTLGVRLVYDESGELKLAEVGGGLENKEVQYQLEQRCYSYDGGIMTLKTEVRFPESIEVVYVMTQEALDEYLDLARDNDDYAHDSSIAFENGTGERVFFQLDRLAARMYTWMILTALVALLVPLNKAWRIGKERIFAVPLEAVLAVWCVILLFANSFTYVVLIPALNMQLNRGGNGIARLFFSGSGYDAFVNMFLWFLLFATVYWSVTCLSAVFTMRGEYFRQRVWCIRRYRAWRTQRAEHRKAIAEGRAKKERFSLKRILKNWIRGIRDYFANVYDMLLHIDFQSRTNRTILTIVIINFFVLLVITWLWFYGVFALIVYSVLLFYFLRKYFDDIQMKYRHLLRLTNELAAGNLDVEIEGDFGIYNPVKDELKKIQSGFQRAVQSEVKSERMKTELITNVSHDLKTPLTAIITYVDLLKNEQDEQKRKEYLEILERKSQRLKVLIEDLFEISKAASKTVKLDLMNVDIVGLLKQVVFENEEKIKAADLKFRWRLPEEKVVMALDSQKTYRIFENLVVNITKYALRGTRAYIDMQVSEGEVSVIMKNVSATEMDFDTEEITDRFVRGDAARNAEGSGLGLAIVKSFTELQKGTLKITTEADLFKICVTLPRQLIQPEQMVEAMSEAKSAAARETEREMTNQSGHEMPLRFEQELTGETVPRFEQESMGEMMPEAERESVCETMPETEQEMTRMAERGRMHETISEADREEIEKVARELAREAECETWNMQTEVVQE